jgi:CubicO group peptidase (beta-lactamase class C family)
LGQILVNTDPKRRNFNRIAQEDLFDPLGMKRTSFGMAVQDPQRVPASVTPMNDGPTTRLLTTMFNDLMGADAEYPSANAFSDVEDVLRFTEALFGRGKVQLLSPEMFALARQNHTGDLKLEALPPRERFAMLKQMIGSVGLPKMIAAARAARGGKGAQEVGNFPARFTLLGGYVRGEGEHQTPAGLTASPNALAAMGGATTGWMVDPECDLTFIFLSAGFVEGMAHPQRLSRLADLAIAAVKD